MRYKLFFKINKPMVLNLNYHLELQRFIYLMISKEDKSYADWLHDQGFGDTKKFKLFTFSKIYCPQRQIKDNKFVMKNCFSFHFSCIDKRLDEIVLKCLNKEKNYMFNNQKIILDRYEVHLYKGSDDIKIKMISPIVVKDAYVENDRKKTYYYSPLEKEFALKINTNFKNKYQIFYDKVPESDICFKLISIQEKDKYVTKYNDFYITGWQGIYELSGKREYLEFLYYVGIGERNSQGFGMFEIIE